ncbi:acetyl-CoA synthetase-like protein [Marasmius fiardii PR-910]|nr:acetyl-CoA synthetase-like protein [Marasmius fiardii PR-910]
MAKTSELTQSPLPIPPQTQALSSSTFRPPPLDGSLHYLDMCDWHYKHSPNHPMFVFSRQDGTTRTITWREAISAVYRGVKLVRGRLGVEPPSSEAPVVGIVAQSVESITYSITQLSLIRAGFIPFLISTRNSLETIAYLLETARVQYVLVGGDKPTRESLEQALDLLRSKASSQETMPKILPMFVFEDFSLDSTVQDETPPPGRLPRKPQDVALYFQSSGSTGTTKYPKIIPWTHRKLIEIGVVPYYSGNDLTGSRVSFHSLSMFHSLATIMMCMMATSGTVAACFEPQSPPTFPTPINVPEAAERTECDVLLTFPWFLEIWCRQPEKLQWLSKRDGRLIFAGSTLGVEVGDKLVAAGIPVTLLYACTEVGMFASFFPKANPGKEWEYFEFGDFVSTNFVPQGDGTFEFIATPSASSIPIFTNANVNGVDGYATGDLLVPHPTKPGYWKVHGRTDDQIVHTSGEKTNPAPLESFLRQDPLIRGAILFGKDRPQVGCILELADPQAYLGNEKVWDGVWPTIEKMNASVPPHSRLSKEMIIFADPKRPFKYTAKGTARRQAILQDYKDEITELLERN